ncbi:DUF2336 domain-containing protein [Sphingomonas elodea]|uniref:DUF2336 domain-containing protein n=1 Tax=Sphingomonas elodea TaxID=179878 RepID=UPI000263069C|nr:DUF2336 domain-containing protein [Sphingomonas elodea]
MAQGAPEPREGTSFGPTDVAARAAAAASHAQAMAEAAACEMSVPDGLRLDERTLRGMRQALERIVQDIERCLAAALAESAFPGIGPTLPLLQAAGLTADPALTAELLAQVQRAHLIAGLPHHAPDDPLQPSLLNRLADHPAPELAAAARALQLAESRAHSPEAGRWRLPPALHMRLLWWVASAMREQLGASAGRALDTVLCAAVREQGADAESRNGAEAAADRLAALLAPTPREVPRLLIDALRDRSLSLFEAVLARAAAIDPADARALLLDPGSERLLLVLRALAVPRETIARIGLLLCDADPRRDLAGLVDAIDALDTIDPEAAQDVLAQLRLDPGYRAARLAIGRRR